MRQPRRRGQPLARPRAARGRHAGRGADGAAHLDAAARAVGEDPVGAGAGGLAVGRSAADRRDRAIPDRRASRGDPGRADRRARRRADSRGAEPHRAAARARPRRRPHQPQHGRRDGGRRPRRGAAAGAQQRRLQRRRCHHRDPHRGHHRRRRPLGAAPGAGSSGCRGPVASRPLGVGARDRGRNRHPHAARRTAAAAARGKGSG